ncbi:hypothetical protein [Enterococcus sp. AZ109]|uniref:hypothetical protein n=1 Tax=Enterococcus sp. AZ109 TaxID=2774634 RepID=UPI003F24987E
MENRPFGGRRARFPAYDDETGVKLNQGSQRVLFDGNDDFITDYKLDAKEVLERANRHTKRSRRVQLDEKPREELARHRVNLPTYETRAHEQRKSSRSLFVEPKQVSDNNRRSLREEKRSSTPLSLREEKRNATPFKPKYVPKSLIPDEPTDAIPLKELYTSLRNSKQAYLLFDTGEKSQQPSIQTRETKSRQSSRLDRSLKGIMNENTEQLEKSKYFHE